MLPVAGVCPVLETPFDRHGGLDGASFERLVEHVYAAGVRQVMFPGYASEFLKLSDAERGELTRLLLATAAGLPGLEVIVSVPDHATLVAVRRATEAASLGASAINVLPPHQLGPDPRSVREHLLAVAEAVAPLPVVVQYAPAQTGTALGAGELAALAATAPNICEVKVESVPPGSFIKALRAQTPALPAAVGYGGLQLIDALRRGAVAVQPGSSFVELYLDIWELWGSGDEAGARELHRRLVPYLSYWMQSVELIVAAEKRISMLRGLIDSDHCRAPARLLDREESDEIGRFLGEFEARLAIVPAEGTRT